VEEFGRDEALMQFMYQSPIGLVQATADGTITLMNPMAAQLLLPLAEQPDETNLLELLRRPVPQLDSLLGNFGADYGVILDSLRVTAAVTPRDPNALRTLEISLAKLDPGRLLATITDVTGELRRQDEAVANRLHAAARTDPLTALPNRAAVTEKLDALLADHAAGTAGCFALAFLDCDRFNHVNDSYGRQTGDELLRALAARLAHGVRDTDLVTPLQAGDWMAARLGGDEFLLVLEGVATAEQALSITRRLLDALGKPYDIAGQTVHVTVSAGVVLPGKSGRDTETLLTDAGLAMSEGRRLGKSGVVLFEAGMRARATHRGRLEDDLHRAIAERELFVVYQPIVQLSDNRACGFEALVRWANPALGLVMPQEFIAIAEESRLIHRLGDFVLEEACRQTLRWHAEAGAIVPAKMSVNLSRAQLSESDIVRRIEHILLAADFPPGRLMLEVTESLAAQGEDIQRRLRSLKDLGIGIALDDFGTGYSSMSSLHLLPVDVIKIDRSFVQQIEHSAHHRVLVEAMVKVARSLGMRTVAEGIETPGQRDILAELDCDQGQGYLFGRPAEGGAALGWLRAHAAGLQCGSGVAPAISC
jgi:diguanylate cyclase (GGDEF)-like protein